MANDIFIHFLELFGILIQIFIIHNYFRHILNKRDIPVAVYALVYGLSQIILLIIFKLIPIPEITIISNYIAIAGISFLYSGNKLTKIISSSFFMVLFMISEVIAYAIYQNIQIESNLPVIDDNNGILLCQLMSKVVLFPLVKVCSTMKKSKWSVMQFKHYLFFIIIPTINIYSVYHISLTSLTQYEILTAEAVLTITGILLATLFVLYLYENTLNKFELEQRNENLKKQMQYQELNYKKSLLSFKRINKVIHETKRHLTYINTCLSETKYNEATDYLKKTLNDVNKSYKIIDTGNQVIDTLISSITENAKEEDILVTNEIRLNGEIKIDNYDLCIVLGNALDNAFEACKKIDSTLDRFININIVVNKISIVIKIINSTNTVIPTSKNKFKTDKEDKIYHGFGIGNIKEIIKKYEGILTLETKDYIFEFKAFMLFPTDNSGIQENSL